MDDGTIHVTKPESVGLSAQRLARITPWMARYVSEGKLPGALTLVARHGQVAYLDYTGFADVESQAPVRADTIFRFYSMTKPITSVAMMMLYEEGRFQLSDPVSRFIPSFADLKVFTGGRADDYQVEPARRPMSIHDLFTHTAGLTYGFMQETPVDELYRRDKVGGVVFDGDLAALVERLSRLPLLSHPGEQWNYSVSTDVLGHLVELISGQSFDVFLQERIFAPLGMIDTGFHVPPQDVGRLAANYQREGPEGGLTLIDAPTTSSYLSPPKFLSGGGGLVSTAADYLQFTQMLLNRGQLRGKRLLGAKTVDYMSRNHLDGDMAAMGQPVFSETSYDGIGFGLGFSVVLDPARAQVLCSEGSYAWGGMASTAFWIDPREDLCVIFLTQLVPSSSYPIRDELRVLVNQAITD
ncbi:MAG: beta-lactamase family protein [Gammaproteobacteria bacterium]|nr:beta-lactamase family protein [Gammaproteobacteria bacterium]